MARRHARRRCPVAQSVPAACMPGRPWRRRRRWARGRDSACAGDRPAARHRPTGQGPGRSSRPSSVKPCRTQVLLRVSSLSISLSLVAGSMPKMKVAPGTRGCAVRLFKRPPIVQRNVTGPTGVGLFMRADPGACLCARAEAKHRACQGQWQLMGFSRARAVPLFSGRHRHVCGGRAAVAGLWPGWRRHAAYGHEQVGANGGRAVGKAEYGAE